MANENDPLIDRLADAVFGNGREGLILKIGRIEIQQETILQVAQDTNAAVHTINGTVKDLVEYRDSMPEQRRSDLVERVERHLRIDAQHAEASDARRKWWRRIGTKTLMGIIGVVLAAMQIWILARIQIGG